MRKTDPKIGLDSHFDDLRKRLIASFLSFAVFSLAAYVFRTPIFYYLSSPMPGPLVFLSPAEALVTHLKISLFVGGLFALPITLWQIWIFVKKALMRHERDFVIKYFSISLLLFLGGVALSWFLFFPAALKILLSFGQNSAIPLISLESYFSFLLTILLAFGFLFELPLVIFALARLGVVETETLRSFRKEAVIFFLVAAAFFTPTADPVSFLFLALPLILLFEITIFALSKTHVNSPQQ